MMRCVFLSIFSVCLVSCATTTTGPAPGDNIPGSLSVCNGMTVSNAPASEADQSIPNYEAVTRIRGVNIARAPVRACVSSGYGPRRGGASSFHDGVDLFTGNPRAVYAGGAGVVTFAGTQRGYGRIITIRHGNRIQTKYAHLSSFARGLSRGDRVKFGQRIGVTGDSGNATAVHLHYEIVIDGAPRNPLTVAR